MSRKEKRAPKKKPFSKAKKQKEHLKRKRVVHKQDKVPPDPPIIPYSTNLPVYSHLDLLTTKSLPLALEEHFDREKVACHEGRKGHQKRRRSSFQKPRSRKDI
ncbi:hypothetical protein CDAR_466921 [Caerostris darwini]|uniref:Uncharacterized protein n=1 Tax=Caerostris darwini TaxID=1538125 RepID=A0AAV4SEM4_9ARAC|nr:hypothetical protein CDAR_466921 [Caerostris darwini]